MRTPQDAAALRAERRTRFAKAVEAHFLRKLRLDVVAVDLGHDWEVMRTDGRELTPAQARAFLMFRAGYSILTPDV